MGPDMAGVDWDRMTPAQKQALLAEMTQLGSLNQETGILDQQIQQAVALRKPSGRQYYGAAAGAIGGIGEALQQVGSVVNENKLRAQQAALMPKLAEGRSK